MTADHQNPAPPKTGRLCLTVAEAAALIGVSPRQVYTLVHKAGLPTIRLGGRLRLFDADAVAMLRHALNAINARKGPRYG